MGAEYPFDGPVARASSNVYTRTGNPDGHATVPAAARGESVAIPDHVVGDGTPESCTPAALAAAVRGGGGAISGLHASIQVLNSMITNNSATGTGASSGLGGNDGGISGDGNTYANLVDGTEVSGNYTDEGGPGILYVSNDRTGTLTLRDSQSVDNTGEDFYTAPHRDVFFLGASMSITDSIVE